MNLPRSKYQHLDFFLTEHSSYSGEFRSTTVNNVYCSRVTDADTIYSVSDYWTMSFMQLNEFLLQSTSVLVESSP
jgi:hypothetical protein